MRIHTHPHLLISLLFLGLSACKPDDDDMAVPSCTLSCQNGGTVSNECTCDCPEGFTGANCQTALTPVGLRVSKVRIGDIDPFAPNGTQWDQNGYPDVRVAIRNISTGQSWSTTLVSNCHEWQEYDLPMDLLLYPLSASIEVEVLEYDDTGTGTTVASMGIPASFQPSAYLNDADGSFAWQWQDGMDVRIYTAKEY